jgi:hypothetical protein
MRPLLLTSIVILAVAPAFAQKPADLTPDKLELVNAQAKLVSYHGHQALQLVPQAGKENSGEAMLAIIKGSAFKNGTIEASVAGAPRPDAPADARGFIGIAFRVQGDKFESFYLRPTNGRADDQLRRNHSLQYVSEPEYPWQRLRKENPGVYESYADLVSGEWTRLKIVVSGTKAQLYINGADQPALIVNDLKLGESSGAIALWSHATTEGYFTDLHVR